ncbi:WXG100 family type VII secretion target [Streptomyces sp. NPDC049687]|uniref:WXG100 family type VII secretion target n=1 Tax=Streptomyces sp. NPDC049687 TaxID=3365596 RepID=UPI00379C37E6
MSSSYFAVNPDGLAKTAPYLRAFSDQWAQIGARLEARLDEFGNCWGDDEMGKAFEEQYLEPRNQMMEGFKGIAEVLDSTADGMETMAKGFQATEDQNTATARGFERGASSPHSNFAPDMPSGDSHGHGSSRG